MSIAHDARINIATAKGKRLLRDMIMIASKEEKQFIEINYLHCHNENNRAMIDWLISEGLHVREEIRHEKLPGFGLGVCDDEDTPKKVTYYIISW